MNDMIFFLFCFLIVRIFFFNFRSHGEKKEGDSFIPPTGESINSMFLTLALPLTGYVNLGQVI